jgi:hypothetical protein
MVQKAATPQVAAHMRCPKCVRATGIELKKASQVYTDLRRPEWEALEAEKKRLREETEWEIRLLELKLIDDIMALSFKSEASVAAEARLKTAEINRKLALGFRRCVTCGGIGRNQCKECDFDGLTRPKK